MNRLEWNGQAGDRASSDALLIYSEETIRHIRAIRLRLHEEVELIDFSSQRLYITRFAGEESSDLKKKERRFRFDILSVRERKDERAVFHLFQARSKQSKHEFVAQRAVEVGIHEIFFFDSAFSDSSPLRTDRLEKIAREAALQCKSPALPALHSIGKLEEFDFSDYDQVFWFYEKSRRKVEAFDGKKIAIIVGSEGGFSEEEAAYAASRFGETYTLGERILRTETAAVCAAAIVIQMHMGGQFGSDGKDGI